MEYCSNSVAETEELGAQLAARLRPGDVVAYTGDLGAGKTAFTRGIARGLGIPAVSYTHLLWRRSGRNWPAGTSLTTRSSRKRWSLTRRNRTHRIRTAAGVASAAVFR